MGEGGGRELIHLKSGVERGFCGYPGPTETQTSGCHNKLNLNITGSRHDKTEIFPTLGTS